MTLRAEDLPKHVRDKLGIPSSKRNRKGVSNSDPCPGSCAVCNEVFDSYRDWEQHPCAQGTARWQVSFASPCTSSTGRATVGDVKHTHSPERKGTAEDPSDVPLVIPTPSAGR